MASNYRAVSLTSYCCKVMKHIVHSHLMKFLEKNKILKITSMASGRRDLVRLSSSPLYMTSQLDWTDRRQQVGAILLDFSKVFIRYPIIALQSSSITMASETNTYSGSRVFSRIEISKWSLLGRHHLVLLSHPEFHRA